MVENAPEIEGIIFAKIKDKPIKITATNAQRLISQPELFAAFAINKISFNLFYTALSLAFRLSCANYNISLSLAYPTKFANKNSGLFYIFLSFFKVCSK